MARYQLRDAKNRTFAEGSFSSAHEARAWPIDHDAPSGWTLLRKDGDRWVAVRHDRSDRRGAAAS